MTDFDQTQWADAAYAREYRDQADGFIPDRRHLYLLVRSFCRRFVAPERLGDAPRVCDLGCGDGVLAEQLLAEFPDAALTLVDGGADMLEAARSRLAGRAREVAGTRADRADRASHRSPPPRQVQASFEALIQDDLKLGPFDVVVSAFAIHHLLQPQKAALFQWIHGQLAPGGPFLNVDTTLPSDPAFIDWHYELWREWIAEAEKRSPRAETLVGIPEKARGNPDNKLSSLQAQLDALRAAGFERVECHYRNGLFSIYSGQRPPP